mgnify:CR=1 FL=1
MGQQLVRRAQTATELHRLPTDEEAKLAKSIGLVLGVDLEHWNLEEQKAAEQALPVLRKLEGDLLALTLVNELERGLSRYHERNRPELLAMRVASLRANGVSK